METMSEALVTTTAAGIAPRQPSLQLPPIPWRDPATVAPEELSAHIARLEQACLDHPDSADLRTCLGMAHAMNYDVYKSMDALEEARAIDGTSFWAQMKYAELHYRLRTLMRAEEETLKAIELAQNAWQLGVARRQLLEIRRLSREGARNVAWTKSLVPPTLALSAMIVLVFVVMLWK
jgi:hypothetical protein